MTATCVDGVAVIAEEPARAPFKDREVYFKQIRLLMLADETTVLGCVHCDYTAASHGSVRGHIGAAHSNRGPRRPAKSASELTLADLLGRLENLDKVVAERDEWRSRALRAEKDLKAIRSALGVTTSAAAIGKRR